MTFVGAIKARIRACGGAYEEERIVTGNLSIDSLQDYGRCHANRKESSSSPLRERRFDVDRALVVFPDARAGATTERGSRIHQTHQARPSHLSSHNSRHSRRNKESPFRFLDISMCPCRQRRARNTVRLHTRRKPIKRAYKPGEIMRASNTQKRSLERRPLKRCT